MAIFTAKCDQSAVRDTYDVAFRGRDLGTSLLVNAVGSIGGEMAFRAAAIGFKRSSRWLRDNVELHPGVISGETPFSIGPIPFRWKEPRIVNGAASVKQVGKETSRYYRMAQTIRKQVAKLPGLARYSNAPGTKKAGNIAFAYGRIDGVLTKIKAFAAGKKLNYDGYAKYPSTKQKKLLGVPSLIPDRAADTEIKILAQILTTTNKRSQGKIFLYTEREACWSCARIIDQFNRLRPDIEIHLRHSFPR